MSKNILLVSIGTRGDMEPFLAIGELLAKRGHRITCLFPEQFRSLAEDGGHRFESLGREFIEMLNSPAGRIAMAGGKMGWKKMKAYAQLIRLQQGINKDMMLKQYEVVRKLNPDNIIHAGKAMYPVIWSITNPEKTTLISPVPYVHYVKNHTHVMWNKDLGPWLNKLTYKLANYGLRKTIYNSTKYLPEENITRKDLEHRLLTNPAVYTISPTLFERPDYWPEQLQVLGYHERNKTINWQPSIGLTEFLSTHEKTLLVTFGSMINDNPEGKTKIVLDVLKKMGIPAILNCSSGGLVEPVDYDRKLFHFVNRIPYDWAFPRVYGVVHHGGSGTTHTALKYGCANLIIPHIIDQYVWNSRIAELGAGPLGVDIQKLNRRNFELLVTDLFSNDKYKQIAQRIGEKIQAEDLEEELVEFILKV